MLRSSLCDYSDAHTPVKGNITVNNAGAVAATNNTNKRYMTIISKNVYVDKLDDIVNEYNNTYHRTIKMKPVDVRDNIYIDFF